MLAPTSNPKQSATCEITFDARYGRMVAHKVCEKHIGWGKARAEEIERS